MDQTLSHDALETVLVAPREETQREGQRGRVGMETESISWQQGSASTVCVDLQLLSSAKNNKHLQFGGSVTGSSAGTECSADAHRLTSEWGHAFTLSSSGPVCLSPLNGTGELSSAECISLSLSRRALELPCLH